MRQKHSRERWAEEKSITKCTSLPREGKNKTIKHGRENGGGQQGKMRKDRIHKWSVTWKPNEWVLHEKEVVVKGEVGRSMIEIFQSLISSC